MEGCTQRFPFSRRDSSVLGAVGFLTFWIRTRFWLPKYIHVLAAIGLIVAVPILAVTLVLVRHVLHGEIYGDPERLQPAVLRPSGEFRVPATRAPVR